MYLITTITLLLIIILVIQYIMSIIETKMIFQPRKIKETDLDTVKLLCYYIQPIKNIKIITNDSNVLDALYYYNPKVNRLIIHAHGNGGCIYGRIEFIEQYKQFGSVLMFDYRGYGLSTGDPSEEGLHEDILSVWNYAIKKLKFKPENIVLYGVSLGCSVVLWLSQYLLKHHRKLPRGVIIESGFYNLKTLACDFIHKNLKYLIRSKFDNIKYIKKIEHHVPLLLIHSYQDDIIDIHHAYRIMKNSKITPYNFILISGSHNEPIYNSENMNRIVKFIS